VSEAVACSREDLRIASDFSAACLSVSKAGQKHRGLPDLPYYISGYFLLDSLAKDCNGASVISNPWDEHVKAATNTCNSVTRNASELILASIRPGLTPPCCCKMLEIKGPCPVSTMSRGGPVPSWQRYGGVHGADP
jgi:hypothetical protein